VGGRRSEPEGDLEAKCSGSRLVVMLRGFAVGWLQLRFPGCECSWGLQCYGCS
jgi:hypothetical protein